MTMHGLTRRKEDEVRAVVRHIQAAELVSDDVQKYATKQYVVVESHTDTIREKVVHLENTLKRRLYEFLDDYFSYLPCHSK